ncbi:class I SAM-dependent methyltransferase [Streptomyces somaliensis DSM 40738]|uniref:Class I SAM-dependent methyltransferase n=1 Tax=Streptomyces somaliensis (strain ATCC 33201 / DSM 40738 / JCM 12659 / KCTC 9044 / NCTC 11332 / NRRL B-12077 / IP 733) TaxID=1134445 RepID=A0AA44D9D9_STRE0|nr:class I SAM-dependent methyltransferase [Streptomyces somaliensis]MCQ0024337.1 class I SAM-dependent methyltransferase [Streptomyces somaliensis DSM 40738]NKY12676.1 class I SAM-dependent methyltransferase [Streptomyces somaliensis DSM 40738]
MTTRTADLWHHYGRVRHAADRAVPDDFRWNWGQDGGPGPEVLGDLAGACVGDLGAGAARHAAHLADRHRPARVDAVDASPAQYAMAVDLYGRLAPRLRIVRSDAVGHLRARPGAYDVLYSVFGAVDFTEPRELLPAAAAALRPGGRLVFSTLGHHLGGTPARSDVRPVDVPARTPGGGAATMRRWVLRGRVWSDLLDRAGFARVTVDVLPGGRGPRAADALLVTAYRLPLAAGA